MTGAKNKIVGSYFSEHPKSASVVLAKMGSKAVASVIKSYELQTIVKTLNTIPPLMLAEALQPQDDALVLQVCNELNIAVTSKIFRRWTIDGWLQRVEKILGQMKPELRQPISRVINYSENAIGSLMNPTPFTVFSELTIKEVLFLLLKERNRYSRYIYVLDTEDKLIGVLPFKDAFYAPRDGIVSKLMTTTVFSLDPDCTVEVALKNTVWTKWDSVPITNSKNFLLGVLRYDELSELMLSAEDEPETKPELMKAGEAVGEIFQIGVNAAVSTLGLSGKNQ